MKSKSTDCSVAIIGAGPYGLSAGAHLRAKGIDARVFGEPMEFWANKMPEGMLLRSPRVASNLSDPDGAFTLEVYESASKTPPSAPLPLDTFVEYGRWFRHQLGSTPDSRTVLRIEARSLAVSSRIRAPSLSFHQEIPDQVGREDGGRAGDSSVMLTRKWVS